MNRPLRASVMLLLVALAAAACPGDESPKGSPATPAPSVTGVVSDGARTPPSLWAIRAQGTTPMRTDVEVPSDPLGMAAGPGGVWIIDAQGVVEVRPRRGVSRLIPLPAAPSAIAIDARFGVWVGGGRSERAGVLWNIDPATGTIVRRFALPARPDGLTVAGRGSPPAVWAFSRSSAVNILQVGADRGRVWSSAFGPITDIASDGFTAWLAGPGGVGPIATLDVPGTFFHQDGGHVEHFGFPGADAVAAGTKTVWVLDAKGERVFPVDRATGHVQAPIRVGAHPTDIALGGRFLWVANDQSVTRIVLTTHVVTTISFPGPVALIAVTEGATTARHTLLWVLVGGGS